MLKKIFIISLLVCSLQGCALLIGGAAIGGAAAAVILYDHRDVKAIFQDNNTVYDIKQKLIANQDISLQCHIVVSSYNGTVLLAGQAPTQALKDKITQITKTIPNIKRLYNELTIEAPSSELTRTSDAWITTKVKTQLLATDALKSGQFKVITENGTVFLMGIVNRSQAQLAVDVSRHIDGVQKVVKVFEYTREFNTTKDIST